MSIGLPEINKKVFNIPDSKHLNTCISVYKYYCTISWSHLLLPSFQVNDEMEHLWSEIFHPSTPNAASFIVGISKQKWNGTSLEWNISPFDPKCSIFYWRDKQTKMKWNIFGMKHNIFLIKIFRVRRSRFIALGASHVSSFIALRAFQVSSFTFHSAARISGFTFRFTKAEIDFFS